VNVLFIGDIVGRPGRRALVRLLPELVETTAADLIIVNSENAAGGAGMSKQIHDQFMGLGVDVLTTGNHVWDRRDFISEIHFCERVIRPANFTPACPGRGHLVIETEAGPAAVINLAGRVYMPPADCPFRAADRVIRELDPDVKVIIIDFHAEATSEKIALARHLDGRVTAIIGTHTHVPTADARVLPGGTACICDVGMTGPSDSVIGVKIQPVLDRFITGMPHRFEPALGPVELHACHLVCDPATGHALSLTPIHRELDGEH
jgi:2',3'-cyclic-nucleotide 2'-phosphodiesterase